MNYLKRQSTLCITSFVAVFMARRKHQNVEIFARTTKCSSILHTAQSAKISTELEFKRLELDNIGNLKRFCKF